MSAPTHVHAPGHHDGDGCTFPSPGHLLPSGLADLLAEITAERTRQDEKWGEQNHPDGTGPYTVWAFTGPASYVADSARDVTEELAAKSLVTWRDIALEEVAEAFAEQDEAKLRTELIQLAAVCVQWVQAIDRRGGTEAASDRAINQLREALSDDSRLAHDIRDGRLPLSQPGNPMGSTDAMGQP